jgi:hypothetical protein
MEGMLNRLNDFGERASMLKHFFLNSSHFLLIIDLINEHYSYILEASYDVKID